MAGSAREDTCYSLSPMQHDFSTRRTRGVTFLRRSATTALLHCSAATHRELHASRRARSDGQHIKQQERRTKQQVGSGPRKRTHRKNAKTDTKRRRRAPGHDLDVGGRPALRPTGADGAQMCASRLPEDGAPGAAGGHGETVRGLCEVPNSKVLLEGVPDPGLEEGRETQAHVSAVDRVQEFR